MSRNSIKDLKDQIKYLEEILELVPNNSHVAAGQHGTALSDTGCNQVRLNLESCIINLKNIVYDMAGEFP